MGSAQKQVAPLWGQPKLCQPPPPPQQHEHRASMEVTPSPMREGRRTPLLRVPFSLGRVSTASDHGWMLGFAEGPREEGQAR